MELEMARFQTFWIQMCKSKPLDESRKTGQTLGTKMAFYSILKRETICGKQKQRGSVYVTITCEMKGQCTSIARTMLLYPLILATSSAV
ncbi:hypothetical protein Hanom_Chr04g00294061 [Helianthus anomalus]